MLNAFTFGCQNFAIYISDTTQAPRYVYGGGGVGEGVGLCQNQNPRKHNGTRPCGGGL